MQPFLYAILAICTAAFVLSAPELRESQLKNSTPTLIHSQYDRNHSLREEQYAISSNVTQSPQPIAIPTDRTSAVATGSKVCGPSDEFCEANFKVKGVVRAEPSSTISKHLAKRAVPKKTDHPWNRNWQKWIVDNCRPGSAEIVPARGFPGPDPLIGIGVTTHRYRELSDSGFNMCVTDVWRCTVVVVASRTAAFMSHIWDFPTFDAGGLEQSGYQSNWDSQVRDYFGKTPGKIHGHRFDVENDNVKIVVLGPRHEQDQRFLSPEEGPPQYPDKTQELIEQLESLFPGVSLKSRFYQGFPKFGKDLVKGENKPHGKCKLIKVSRRNHLFIVQKDIDFIH